MCNVYARELFYKFVSKARPGVEWHSCGTCTIFHCHATEYEQRNIHNWHYEPQLRSINPITSCTLQYKSLLCKLRNFIACSFACCSSSMFTMLWALNIQLRCFTRDENQIMKILRNARRRKPRKRLRNSLGVEWRNTNPIGTSFWLKVMIHKNV